MLIVGLALGRGILFGLALGRGLLCGALDIACATAASIADLSTSFTSSRSSFILL